MRSLPKVMAGVVTLAMTGGLVVGATGVASAATGTYDPNNPPYPADANSVTTVRIYDATTGVEVKSGNTDTPLSNYYFASAADFGTPDGGSGRKAQLSGFLAESGKAPTAFSGQLVGAATTFPVTVGSTTFSNPTARGDSAKSFGSLAAAFPNTALSTDNFYQLYQLRVRTTFPTPTSTTYAIVDVQIDPATGIWHEVKPATAPYSDPVNRPAAPTATAGDGKASLTFTAPTAPAGAPVLDYSVVATPTSPPGPALAPVVVSGSPATISGLTNGTTYSFSITARNANGSSARSAASNSVTPQAATAPTAPAAPTATAGDGSATVTFAAPSSDGGSPITSYTATSTPGGLTGTSSTVSPITVTGLANSTAYTFTVHATNTVGSSSESAASNAVTPKGVTSVAVSMSAGPYYDDTDITFTAAVTASGSPVNAGTVAFTDSRGDTMGSGVVDASGVATYAGKLAQTPPGASHVVTASYTDGATYAPSSGTTQPFSVAGRQPFACTSPAPGEASQCTDQQYFTATVAAGSLVISTPYVDAAHAFNLGTLQLDDAGTLLSSGKVPFGSATVPATQPARTDPVSAYESNYSGVTIVDGRPGQQGWNASLSSQDFVGAGTNKIDARNLGFTEVQPYYVPGNALQSISTFNKAAGLGIAPSNTTSTDGLKDPFKFASAPVGASVGTVYVGGNMTLNAPTSTSPGIYTAVVTFTIV